jgi:CBS domain-containing protein
MTISVGSIMTRDVITARPDDSVATVAALLSTHEISAVPVCDKDGKLLGIVSEGDLMQPFGQENALRRSWWLAMLAEGTELAPEFLDYVRLDHRRVDVLMNAEVITASEQASAAEVADLLMKHRIKRVPVMRDGRVVGIVSRADLIRAMSGSPDVLTDLL